MTEMTGFLHGWLAYRGKTQAACNVMLPHEDNILNTFRMQSSEYTDDKSGSN